jgi:hypothetical protein
MLGQQGAKRWNAIVTRCSGTECATHPKRWRLVRNGTRFENRWYCGASCLETAVRISLERLLRVSGTRRPAHHRVPLGLLLLSRGQLTEDQLRRGLAAQQASGNGRLGEWLEWLGYVTEQQVITALSVQWACPVLPARLSGQPLSNWNIPYRLLESSRMLPVKFVSARRALYVAFSGDVDYSALHAIEQMLDCKTEACLLESSAMDQRLARLGEATRASELVFETASGESETAHILCAYVARVRGEAVRLASCGDYVWSRILTRGKPATDLLFLRRDPALTEKHLAQEGERIRPRYAARQFGRESAIADEAFEDILRQSLPGELVASRQHFPPARKSTSW